MGPLVVTADQEPVRHFDLGVQFVGPTPLIEPEVARHPDIDSARVRVVDAPEVVAITLLVAAALILFNPTYVSPYTSFIGQFVLFIVIALYAVGLVWLRRLAKIEVPERFLIRGDDKRARKAGDDRMEVVGG